MIKFAIENTIDNLYHYQKFNEEYITDLLLNDRIKFSNPSGFNDPWDCRLNFSKTILDDPAIYKANVDYAIDIQRRHLNITESELTIRAERLRSDRGFMEARIDEYTLSMNYAINKDYRIYCLSSEPNNFLMWAHYADSHKGICFGFKTDSDTFSYAMEVTYSEMYPQINPAEENEIKFLCDVLLTKAKAWNYEKEFRLIAKESNSENFFSLQSGDLSFNPSDLVSIIVGCSVSEVDIKALKKILNSRKLPIKLFQVRPAGDRYSLIVHDL